MAAMPPIGSVADLARAARSRAPECATSPSSTALRTPCNAARSCGSSTPTIRELAVAGLVHDIADIAYPDDHTDHDRRGAELVGPLLGDRGRAPRRRARDREALPRDDRSGATAAGSSPRSAETLARAGRRARRRRARPRSRPIPTSTRSSICAAPTSAPRIRRARVPGLDVVAVAPVRRRAMTGSVVVRPDRRHVRPHAWRLARRSSSSRTRSRSTSPPPPGTRSSRSASGTGLVALPLTERGYTRARPRPVAEDDRSRRERASASRVADRRCEPHADRVGLVRRGRRRARAARRG